MSNVEDFISGTANVRGDDFWARWFSVSANPEHYTPYGQYLAGTAGVRARLVNARNEELTIGNWSGGFLSNEICRAVSGTTNREECFISTPGKVIQEALSFNLDSERQALITADEIDEVMIALVGQLAKKAITGSAGLLGLTNNSNYGGGTYNSGGRSFVSNMTSQANNNFSTDAVGLMVDARDEQNRIKNSAVRRHQDFDAIYDNYVALSRNRRLTSSEERLMDRVQVFVNETANIRDTAEDNYDSINDMIVRYRAATKNEDRISIFNEFNRGDWYNEVDRDYYINRWTQELRRY